MCVCVCVCVYVMCGVWCVCVCVLFLYNLDSAQYKERYYNNEVTNKEYYFYWNSDFMLLAQQICSKFDHCSSFG